MLNFNQEAQKEIKNYSDVDNYIDKNFWKLSDFINFTVIMTAVK